MITLNQPCLIANDGIIAMVNGRVILKFSNSVLVPKGSSSLFSNFIVNLCIIPELNNWARRQNTNDFLLKIVYLIK